MTTDIAVRAEGLSKLYRIGAVRRRHDTLRDYLADRARAWGRLEQARTCCHHSLRTYDEIGEKAGVVECIELAAGIAVRDNRADWAVQLLSAMEEQRALLGAPRTTAEQADVAHVLEVARNALGDAADEGIVRLAKGRPGRAIALAAQGLGAAGAQLSHAESAIKRGEAAKVLVGLYDQLSGEPFERLAAVLELAGEWTRAIGVEQGGEHWADAWSALETLRSEAEGLDIAEHGASSLHASGK